MSENITTLYLVRHCLSSGNKGGVFAGGTSEYPLTEEGLKQAEALRKRFAEIDFDAIYSSPRIRAVDTAKIIRDKRQVEIQQTEDLTEYDFGKYNTLGHDAMSTEQYNTLLQNFMAFAPEGGENAAKVLRRAQRVFTKIISENIGKTILVVTHGCFLRHALVLLSDCSCEALNNPKTVANASVSKIVIKGNKCITEYIGDLSHLDK